MLYKACLAEASEVRGLAELDGSRTEQLPAPGSHHGLRSPGARRRAVPQGNALPFCPRSVWEALPHPFPSAEPFSSFKAQLPRHHTCGALANRPGTFSEPSRVGVRSWAQLTTTTQSPAVLGGCPHARSPRRGRGGSGWNLGILCAKSMRPLIATLN